MPVPCDIEVTHFCQKQYLLLTDCTIGFSQSSRSLAAHNFTMPALSPTMTEGNISTWRVKEGETFVAGDVLLEIETDKATMDVEAQDDGIVMKIMSSDGAKGVPVGTRIAVLAEAGDDISALEIPADEQPSKAAATAAPTPAPAQASSEPAPAKKAVPRTSAASGTYNHSYPLLPSVGNLVKQNGLSESDVAKIKGTGPSGRLLKGDVLAYLGTINADTPETLSAHFEKLSHLDLSNIKVAAPKEPKKEVAAPVAEDAPLADLPLEINVPVSLAKVVEVQKRIEDKLDIFLPISTFIARAAEIANDDLPPSQHEPTASELFDAVLGLDKVKTTRGVYLPQISAIPSGASFVPRDSSRPAKRDLIDELAGTPVQRPSQMVTVPTVAGLSSGANVFSLVVPRSEAERAHVFLQRCKLILEEEPGRLVL